MGVSRESSEQGAGRRGDRNMGRRCIRPCAMPRCLALKLSEENLAGGEA